MKNRVIAYDRNVGIPLSVMNFENCWWVVSPDSCLQKLKVYSESMNSDFFSDIDILTVDNKVRMRPLLTLLGCIVAPGFDTPEREMTDCMERLEDMGAEMVPPTGDVKLRAEVRKLPEGSARDGEYCLLLMDTTSQVEHIVMNADGFDDWHNAVETARAFETWLDEYLLQWGFRCKIKEMKLPKM